MAAIPTDSGDKRPPKINAVRAVADAHATSSSPRQNFGRARRLIIDARPQTRAYLRFAVDLESDEVRRVNLLVYSHTRSRVGYQVRIVTERWRERRITFENSPPASSRFVASGPIRAGAWKAVDVTALVTGSEDDVSFALTTSATRAIVLASRHSGVKAPRLVVERRPKEDTRSTSTQAPGTHSG